MKAKISSIKLNRHNDSFYWKITLVDEEGNIIGTFGDETNCNDINFRKETFYLMKILKNWDLLKLDGQKKAIPMLVDNEYGFIDYIANEDGDYLKFDYKTGEVLNGSGLDVSDFIEAGITSLESKSLSIIAEVSVGLARRGLIGSVYRGFSPLYSREVTEEQEKNGARSFKEFVYGVLRVCKFSELIQSNTYPEVSVKLDSNGNVVAIGNLEESEYLYNSDNGYEFVEGEQKIR